MTSSRRLTIARTHAFAILTILASASCGDDTPSAPPAPVLTTISVTLPATSIEIGQTVTPTSAGLDQNGAAIVVPTVTWSTASAAVATVDASGVIKGVSEGTTQIIATAGGKTGQQTITVTAPVALIFNEVESNGGTPGDWVEIFNPTSAPVDISGWGFRDNDSTHVIYRFPAGTTVAAGGYFVAEEAAFGFGLGAAADVHAGGAIGGAEDAGDRSVSLRATPDAVTADHRDARTRLPKSWRIQALAAWNADSASLKNDPECRRSVAGLGWFRVISALIQTRSAHSFSGRGSPAGEIEAFRR